MPRADELCPSFRAWVVLGFGSWLPGSTQCLQRGLHFGHIDKKGAGRGLGVGGLIPIAWSCIEKICFSNHINFVDTSIYVDWNMECLPQFICIRIFFLFHIFFASRSWRPTESRLACGRDFVARRKTWMTGASWINWIDFFSHFFQLWF